MSIAKYEQCMYIPTLAFHSIHIGFKAWQKMIHDNQIGHAQIFKGPFGYKPILYCDYIASGRSLKFIEDKISQICEKLFCWAERPLGHQCALCYPPQRSHPITTPLFKRAVSTETSSIWGLHVLTSTKGVATRPSDHRHGQCQGHRCTGARFGP